MTRHARILALAGLAALLAAAAAPKVPLELQQRIEDHFAPSLVLPDTTIWRFEDVLPYFSGGKVVCGKLNLQDSTHTYIGWRGFYVVVRGDTISFEGLQPRFGHQDPTGSVTFSYNLLCHRHDAPPPD